MSSENLSDPLILTRPNGNINASALSGLKVEISEEDQSRKSENMYKENNSNY